MYELLGGDSHAQEGCEKAGSIATFGIGRTVPQGWIDAGDFISKDLKGIQIPDPAKDPADQKQHPSAYLQYNEYICYNIAQIQLRYSSPSSQKCFSVARMLTCGIQIHFQIPDVAHL